MGSFRTLAALTLLSLVPLSPSQRGTAAAQSARQGVKPAETSSKAAAVTTPIRAAMYTVRSGDTLGKIAARFNTTVDKLKSWNRLQSNRLAVGKKLVVSPAPVQAATTPAAKKVIHQVRQGETLDRIATTYKTSVDAIISWNESEDLSVLHPGDRITIFVGDNN